MSFYKSFEVLLLLSLQFNCQFGHWVDVPEFSDDDKVYRLPSSKRSVIFKYPKVPASSKLDDDFTLKNHSDDHPSRFLMERDPYEIFNVPKSIVSSTTTTSSAAESYYPSEFSEASTEDSLREFAKRLDKIHETRDKVEEDEEEFEIEESYSVKKAHPGSPADNFTLKVYNLKKFFEIVVNFCFVFCRRNLHLIDNKMKIQRGGNIHTTVTPRKDQRPKDHIIMPMPQRQQKSREDQIIRSTGKSSPL